MYKLGQCSQQAKSDILKKKQKTNKYPGAKLMKIKKSRQYQARITALRGEKTNQKKKKHHIGSGSLNPYFMRRAKVP